MHLRSHLCFFFFILSMMHFSCKREAKEAQIFEQLSSSKTNITFANTIVTDDSINAVNYEYIYNGGGVAVGDINNDGLPDLFFSGNMESSRLYLNKGNFEFEDLTEKAGVGTQLWATGASMIDINADGFLDIYVCIASKEESQSANLLFINNGNQTFSEKAKEYGIADKGYSTHAAFFDYDKDGDLDMYLLTNGYENFNRNQLRPKKKNGEGNSTDKLYRNKGDGTFEDVSAKAGILVEGYGLGVAIADINQDGWPDVYVANDFITNDLLWINNGNGTFTESADKWMKHQSHNAMGTDVADFNNDGLLDIVVMDMLPEDNLRQKSMFSNHNYDLFMMNQKHGYTPQYVRNTLQLNNGNGTFSEVGQLAGIHKTDWSWSALFSDFDNDGLKDLLVTNGYRKDVTNLDFIVYRQQRGIFGNAKSTKENTAKALASLEGAYVHNYLFKNEGDLTFSDKSYEWGFGEPSYSNGAAFVDLDNDGDMDVVTNNIDQKASVYRNNADKVTNNNYVQLKLIGSEANKVGFGAKITLNYQNKVQFHEHNTYRGYKSTVDDIIHFGMGSISSVDSLTVVWPDGKYQELHQVKTNQRLVVKYEDAQAPPSFQEPGIASSSQLFSEISGKNGVAYKHQENDYKDFKVQHLVPHKFSQNGPGIAVGDVTGNGLDDFYIGGAAGFSGKLFYQVKPEVFEGKEFTGALAEEDMGSLFFDADGDGDLDLYVVSGGSEHPDQSLNYKDRLYFNDEKGNFTLNSEALPEIISSGSSVVAADYDKDGDLDLFVGGRVVPGKYPVPAKSYILQNDKGKFKDVTQEKCPELESMGLVTAALWTDFDNDNKIDLIVVGEWMPLSFFKNTGESFENITSSSGLEDTHGWWNSLAAGDFDGDGDTDYIAGNLGLNSIYKASVNQPVRVYAKDFDKNGSIDPILTHYINGKEYPTHPRDNLTDQLNFMRGKFTTYNSYGQATIDQVLTKKELKEAYKVESEYFQSSYIENKGNGKFVIQALPIQAQLAPVYGILTNDFDGDGYLDVLISGNSYATEILTGWYDASIGLLLKGDGKGSFTPVNNRESGFFVDKDSKGIAEVNTGNDQSLILIACNSDSLKAFQQTHKKDRQYLRLKPNDAYAIVNLKDGSKLKKEFYYGSSYLSQSSRFLELTKEIFSLTIYNFSGEERVLYPEAVKQMMTSN